MPAADLFSSCVDLLKRADGLLITAGAGMGVDAGLPDFRSDNGFWRAYPALGRAGLCFEEVACPDSFDTDAHLAWGFYGHRLNLYRETPPHEGHRILRSWAEEMPAGAFVFTSNVDGMFQQAGFADERIHECHGSIHYLQCTRPCSSAIWEAADLQLEVDREHCRLLSAIPRCPRCGAVSRPNILMFGDGSWIEQRAREQFARMQQWLRRVGRLLVIELGAGTHIPTVRYFGETQGAPLIRINPTEAQLGPGRGVSLPMGALKALRRIDSALENA